MVAGDTVFVNPQTQYVIGAIKLNLVLFEDQPVLQSLPNAHRAATRDNISKLRESILRSFQDDGNYFASITADTITLDHDKGSIDFVFKLIAGPQVELERVRFRGLKKTQMKFAHQLSGLKIGQTIGPDDLQNAVSRIETASWLTHDSLPRIIPNRSYDRMEVLFILREQRMSSLELVGGYLPSDEIHEGEMVGRVHFKGQNLFGWGRRFEFLYDKKDRKSSHTRLDLIWPLFIPDHLELNLNLHQLDYDSSYTEFGMTGGVGLYHKSGSFLAAGIGWVKTEPQNSSQAPSRRISAFLKQIADNRDDRFNPYSGGRIYFEISYLRRVAWPLEGENKGAEVVNNDSKFDLGLDYSLPLGSVWTVRANLRASALFTSRDLIDLSEKFKMGGFGSLRGYRQEQFAGRRVLLSQTELRWRPNRRTAFYLFYDFGVIYSRMLLPSGDTGSETLQKPGFGYGIYVGGDGARMTLETGWGEGDRLSEGKIHFGVTALF